MGRETLLRGDIYVLGVEINKEDEIDRFIEEIKEDLAYTERQIRSICHATPKDIFPNDTYFELNQTISELFESFHEDCTRLANLYTIRTNKDCIVDTYADLDNKIKTE